MKHLVSSAVLLVALAGCASTPTVHTDYDPGTPFSSYRTYTWLKKPEGRSPLVEQRVVAAIDAKLAAHGWQQTSGTDADVGIAAHVATQQQQTLDTFYSGPAWGGYGWGRWGGGVGMGSATTTVRNYEVGTLVVDMFDMKTKQAIWRGTASGTVPDSPEQVNAKAQAGVDKMFADFPPGSAPAK
ncbi:MULTISPECIES: DUF4136 domain-containing protein [unclassified Lysobacter]|uniref:DUF4136 domain-containing protein n=1 Tax=unclassified Lysobacter TaxID=2635362 RepID=UPI001C2215B1|nr:DUF4136 domain-containing protein [Lysobacter sp. MMG2]MBU8977911.1 DUF4136 domain-containing protein [Lysobacter sp. MMG2]